MKAIIVAAGVGSRLGDLTKNLPKPLLDVNGKSILEHQIELFHKFGIKDVIIIRGPHKEKFHFDNVRYIEDTDYQNHDLLGSLMMASKEMNDDLIISYGDIIFDEKIMKKIISFDDDAGLVIDLNWEKNYQNKSKELIDKVSVTRIQNNFIDKIGYKKNMNLDNNVELAEFIGIMKFSKKVSQIFTKKFFELETHHTGKFYDSPSLTFGIITDMIEDLITDKIKFLPISIDGVWCEIDTVEDLQNAKKLFSKN
jgi:phosphoenolpyruvate phosphomutase